MQARRHRAALLVAAIALGCSGNEDDSEVNRDAGGSVRDGGATVRDGGPYAGDHGERCAMACVDPGTDHDVCGGADSELCGRFCREVLSGFSEDCGTCLAERASLIFESTQTCTWNGDFDRGFEECHDRCPLNRTQVSSEDLEAKCASFCIVNSRRLPQPCDAETSAACRERCQAYLQRQSTACAACVLGSGLRPTSYGDDLSSRCYPEQFGTSGPCEAYCD